MKNNRVFRFLTLAVLVLTMAVPTGCGKTDRSDSSQKTAPVESRATETDLPLIKSSDTTMALYMNIGLFDEENYSSVYLGDRIDLSMKYDGIQLSVPSSSATLAALGFAPENADISTAAITVKAGETLEMNYTDQNKKMLHVYFYNETNRTVPLSDCKAVRLKIDQNAAVIGSADYGSFEIGGLTNGSVITDVMEKLGTPSHFHNENNGIYSLDFFVAKADRRNKITVWVDTHNDCICSLAISDYR